MIVLSDNIVLQRATADEPLDTPIFGWRSLVGYANVVATSEAPGYPASNIANASTVLRWRAEPEGSPAGPPSSDQLLTVTFDSVSQIDYLAIAGHNLGSGRNALTVEGRDGSTETWTELVQENMAADDSPIIFRFAPQSLAAIRLRIRPGLSVPEIAVMYVGKLLVCERGTHASHTPINFGRVTRVLNGRSEKGNFLGRIVLSESRSTTLALRHLRQSWYRSQMEPFVRDIQHRPFFFAWRPKEFPNDVGFCWASADVQPTVDFDTGRISVNIQMDGAVI